MSRILSRLCCYSHGAGLFFDGAVLVELREGCFFKASCSYCWSTAFVFRPGVSSLNASCSSAYLECIRVLVGWSVVFPIKD